MQYLISFMRHAEAVHRAAACHPGLSVRIDLGDFRLQLAHGGSAASWRPRFMTSAPDGRLLYVDRPDPSTRGFVGWTPYSLRQWPASTDKLVFKQVAEAAGILTPAACTDPAQIGGPFLVKKRTSSFGEGIRGPFVRYAPDDPLHQLGDGEFYENFILGHIVKAWYWGSRWRVAEFRAPPVVTGDGRTSLRELVGALPNPRKAAHDWAALALLARYCGLEDVDDVPSLGKEVLVDFKYASRYEASSPTNLNVIHNVATTPLGAQFERAGRVFAEAVSPHYPPDRTLFALDAMVDQHGKAWFLEMNSNPMVHPDLYAPMIAQDILLAAPETSSMAG